MLKLFEGVKDFVKSNDKIQFRDSWIVRLNYATATLLLIFSVLVGAKQYIGEPISCFHGRDKDKFPYKVVNQYCFIKTTYTVPDEKIKGACDLESSIHPGVRSSAPDDPVILHAYYQWVPVVLLLQCLSFLLPHFFWSNCEGGLIDKLLNSNNDIDLQKEIEDERKKEEEASKPKKFRPRMQLIAEYYMGTVKTHQFLAFGWFACDFLGIVITVLNFYLTNSFLGGNFSEYGLEVYNYFMEEILNPQCLAPVDWVFPKVTKCNFFKYGPSGTIENIDVMCVLALNILNEKVYTILWFWFVFVIFFSIVGIVLKLIAYVLLTWKFSIMLALKFFGTPMFASSSDLRFLPRNLLFSDWIFFSLLTKSMTPYMYKQFVQFLTNEKKNVDGISFFGSKK